MKLKNERMRLFLLILSSCYFPYSILAQNIFISGYAPSYKGAEITMFSYADFISNSEIPVSTQTVSDSGFFNFSFQSENIKRILLRSGNQKANMYVEPTYNYKIFFPARDSIRFVNPSIEQSLDLTFAITDTTEINALVIDYNEQFENFWSENYQYFVQKKSRTRLDTFEIQMLARYSKINKPYFKSYITYDIAELDLNTFQSKLELAKKYIIGKPVLNKNYEYMSFFNAFFNHYLQQYTTSVNGRALVEQINTKSSFEGCMNVLAEDKYLKTDTLRELVLIKGLSELYYSTNFRRENVLYILEQIASTSKIAENQNTAANVIHSFSKLKPGTLAPEFSLTDKNGKTINLTDFKGKYVYLTFWTTWCTSCLQEMKLISNLKKKYGDKITFVSINIDEDPVQMNKFLAKNQKLDWVFLNYSSQKEVKYKYEIKSVPSYFLINPYGNFQQAQALRPTQSIEATFYEIRKKKSRSKGP